MMSVQNFLFIYGSLLDKDNEFGAYLQINSKFVSYGKFKGKLYAIGNYPGAVADQHSTSYVYGSIVKLNPEFSFSIIDEYEGFSVEQPQPNEFIRSLLDIDTETGCLKCWVYLYNLSVTGLTLIGSGKNPDKTQ